MLPLEALKWQNCRFPFHSFWYPQEIQEWICCGYQDLTYTHLCLVSKKESFMLTIFLVEYNLFLFLSLLFVIFIVATNLFSYCCSAMFETSFVSCWVGIACLVLLPASCQIITKDTQFLKSQSRDLMHDALLPTQFDRICVSWLFSRLKGSFYFNFPFSNSGWKECTKWPLSEISQGMWTCQGINRLII